MTPAERLSEYIRELVDLGARRVDLLNELAKLEEDIYDKMIEIRECEAYMMSEDEQ